MNKQERPWFDPFSIGCLFLMLFLASYSLEETVWVADLNHVTALALLGLTIGLMLGQSQFNSQTSFWLGLFFSIEFLSWQVIFTGSGNLSWIGKANLLFSRIYNAFHQLINNQPLQDGVLFFIGMAFLFWFLGLLSGYHLTRYGKPWLSLLIAGVLIFIIQLFQASIFRNSIFSSFYAFLFLILMARLKYLSSHLKWEKQNTTEDKDTQSIFNRFAFILSLIIIMIAWNTPYLIKAVTSGSKEQMELRDHFKGVWTTAENFFAPFKQKSISQAGFLGDVLTLGADRTTKEDVLFTVTTPGSDIYRNRYYWRERFYDQYQSGFWQNSSYSEQKILANQPIDLSDGTENRIGLFSVHVFSHQFAFISPQIPLTINQETTLLLLNNSERRQVISIIPNKTLESGENYDLEAAILNPFLEDLLAAKSAYPKWVTDSYLQIPAGISPKIRDLSISLTQDKYNIYDKIQAITNYLRKNYSYADSISDLPLENSDPIEWFLFTKKSGFCTYFASAEVLLLRSIGIPARLAAGYAQGELLRNGNEYEVRDKDNHAWPEVYFDGIGWIAFEPTPSQPTIDYQTARIFTNSEGQQIQNSIFQQTMQPYADGLHVNLWQRVEMANLPPEPGPQSPINSPNLNSWNLLGIALIFLFLFFVLIRRFSRGEPFLVIIETQMIRSGIEPPIWFMRWERYAQLLPIGKVFSQIDFMLIFMGKNLNFSDTPRQKVSLLQKIVPGGIFYLNQLLEEYERELFGPYQANLVVARNSIKEVWKLVFIKWVMESRDYLKKKIVKLFRQ